MTYEDKKTELVKMLTDLGYEVITRKSVIPDKLPAAIIALTGEVGAQKTSGGYAKHKHKADIYLVIDDSDTADVDILAKAHALEAVFYQKFYEYFAEIEVYDSSMNAVDPVLIAHVKVEI